jgi:HlyD family secretion protein
VVDRPLPDRQRRRRVALRVAVASGLSMVATLALAWSSTRPANVARVRRASVTIAEAEQGTFVAEIRARGHLDAREVHFISAASPGRIEAMHAEVGDSVEGGQVLFTLQNPEVQLAAAQADSELAKAKAELETLRAGFRARRLALDEERIRLQARRERAEREHASQTELTAAGASSPRELASAKTDLREVTDLLRAAARQAAELERSETAELKGYRERIVHLTTVRDAQHRRLDELQVRAPRASVLKERPVQLGEWVTSGRLLARVVDPHDLEAKANVGEVDIARIAVGMAARIVIEQQTVRAEVRAIAPSARDGAVDTRLRILDPLPASARIDQGVDVFVETHRAPEVVMLRRPVGAVAHAQRELFVLEGITARRRSVALGEASDRTIVIESGLAAGETVIVSETTRWEDAETLELVE